MVIIIKFNEHVESVILNAYYLLIFIGRLITFDGSVDNWIYEMVLLSYLDNN